MTKKNKNALVLGVTGQGGSFMAKLLLEKKYTVYGLVRKSATGNLKNILKYYMVIYLISHQYLML